MLLLRGRSRLTPCCTPHAVYLLPCRVAMPLRPGRSALTTRGIWKSISGRNLISGYRCSLAFPAFSALPGIDSAPGNWKRFPSSGARISGFRPRRPGRCPARRGDRAGTRNRNFAKFALRVTSWTPGKALVVFQLLALRNRTVLAVYLSTGLKSIERPCATSTASQKANCCTR